MSIVQLLTKTLGKEKVKMDALTNLQQTLQSAYFDKRKLWTDARPFEVRWAVGSEWERLLSCTAWTREGELRYWTPDGEIYYRMEVLKSYNTVIAVALQDKYAGAFYPDEVFAIHFNWYSATSSQHFTKWLYRIYKEGYSISVAQMYADSRNRKTYDYINRHLTTWTREERKDIRNSANNLLEDVLTEYRKEVYHNDKR